MRLGRGPLPRPITKSSKPAYNKFMHADLLAAVRAYQMPEAAVELLKANPPLILAAVSAAGKDTIAKYVIEHSDYRRSISHTTRPMRAGEENGVDYWFVTEAEMLELISHQALIETQAVHGETVYGSSLAAYQQVVADGHRPLLIMDIQGVDKLTRRLPSLRPYFILPPSYEEWLHRLAKRGSMGAGEKTRRLASARKEIEYVLRQPHFHLVVNREVPVAAAEILSGRPGPAAESNRALAHDLLNRLKTG